MRALITLFLVPQLALASEYVLPEISVLGESQKKSVTDFVPTVSELSGNRLNQKRQNTIGETLSQEAGVNSTYFGPNSSRPVIRGLDGDRVRILQNGVGSMDASGASPDHAVSADPFSLERVEIVRGSAALLYGSSAIGGVVNLVDGRIPERENGNRPATVGGRYSSVDQGWAALLSSDFGSGKNQFHSDLIKRRNQNTKTPVATQNPIANSAGDGFDGGFGYSRILDSGYVGTSFSYNTSNYGTVAEPDVTIGLEKQRVDVAGAVSGTRFRTAYSYYKHQEYEGSEVGTQFLSRAAEGRVDHKHKTGLGTEGIVGAQAQYTDFSANGEEAFLPGTKTTAAAIFLYEELKQEKWTPSLGARLEGNQVRADSATRAYFPKSLALGLLYKIDDAYSLGVNTTVTERAPNYQELFAGGNHIATGIEENGDLALSMERAQAIELSLRHKNRPTESRFTIFAQNFSTFIALVPNGLQNGDGLDIYNFQAIHARIYGAEFEYRRELSRPALGGILEVDFKMDFVRGQDLTHRTNLPRMSPIRENLALEHRTNSLRSRLELSHNHRQTQSAPNETHTAGYFMTNISFEAPFNTSWGVLQTTLRLNNIFDVEARNHVSFLKDLAPLPGRNLILGITAKI
ncbi:MAG: TonB-dependent receptor [Bdellovibrionales bacterium]|nr:TonB-dependent receptor [Bdellovibrionales bacterium]